MKTGKYKKTTGYLSLCYHYIRKTKKSDPFPRLLGNSVNDFFKHIKMLRKNYEIIQLDEARDFLYSKFILKSKRLGMLFTFDDGLSDHYLAGQILSNYRIKGVFFIPTCILKDKLPANPTIIHYSLAIYGINRFLKSYHFALEKFNLDFDKYGIKFKKCIDDPWVVIGIIKNTFKYILSYSLSRNVLLHIYNNLLVKDYPNALNIMHMKLEQIRDLLNMGHSIGVHSHSHISVAAVDLNKFEFQNEIVMPKKYLENTFGITIYAISYPFGEKKDCFTAQALLSRTKEYSMAFSIENKLNMKDTSPLELGRYMLKSTDDENKLKEVIETIIERRGVVL